MNFYNILFVRVFNSLYQTNKSIPEWSSIVAISMFLFFNIISILLFFDVEIILFGSSFFQYTPLVLITLNYFYFLHDKKYLHFLEKYNRSSYLSSVLVLIYIFASTILFFKMLKMDNKYTIGIIGVYGLLILNAYLKGKK